MYRETQWQNVNICTSEKHKLWKEWNQGNASKCSIYMQRKKVSRVVYHT